ncbi:MAG: aconitate hydratase, partial [Chloroflexota bacterium]|nr:aconitate hydratase [Chloroflexota bacterium]
MGILPLQFQPGESAESLGLSGRETYTLRGIAGGLAPGGEVEVAARTAGGSEIAFTVVARLDSLTDVDYHRHGGVLPLVLRQLMSRS